MRIHLASTRVRHIRSVYPEISVYALQSGNFCIRCVSGYVWTLVSVYFCIRWRHSIRTSLNAHALLTNPLRCPDTNRISVDGRVRFVYATCGRRYFFIRIKKFPDTKISGYVWTGPKSSLGRQRNAASRKSLELQAFSLAEQRTLWNQKFVYMSLLLLFICLFSRFFLRERGRLYTG